MSIAKYIMVTGMNSNLIVKATHKKLIGLKKTVAVAESCTGGLVSALLTSFSGSSAYFILGITAYSNQSKSGLLKLPLKLLRKKGAVSKETACGLACSVRALARSDFGIGITGIAGPAGGTKTKPVGTVFISVSGKKLTLCKKFLFPGNRTSIRKQAALAALKMLNSFLNP